MYPSFIGFSPLKPDRFRAMDPEPDRCQRSDGKKWRCSKEVIPNEKYCEVHMHRGRNRGSRKLVEGKEIIPKPDNKNHVRSMVPISSSVKSYGDIRIARNGLGQSLPGKNKESTLENANLIKIKYGTAKNNHPGFGSSPKSVLHCGAGKIDYDTKNTIKNVPQRCNRTDGKNWQCRQDALLDEKYCEKHMHRGMKRAMPNLLSQPPRKARTSCTIITSPDNTINLNTIPTSPQLVSDDGSTSSSSEATTISD